MIWQDRAPTVMGRPTASDVEQEFHEAIKVNVIRLLSVVGDRAPAALDRLHATTVELRWQSKKSYRGGLPCSASRRRGENRRTVALRL